MATTSIVIPTIKGRKDLLTKLHASLPIHMQKIIIRDEDLPLSAKRNKGAAIARGRYILFIDDDNHIQPGAIEKMMNIMQHDRSIGIMGMVACYDDRPKVVADGGSFRNYLTGFMKGLFTNTSILAMPKDIYEVDEVANAFMMRRQLFRKLGGFDQIRFPMDLDEADICYRAKKAGYRIVMCPEAVCYHKSITYSYIPDFRRPQNAYYMGRNRVLFQRKHSNTMQWLTYLAIFMPVFVLSYCLCLLYRRKPEMVYHFLKGVLHGLQNRIQDFVAK